MEAVRFLDGARSEKGASANCKLKQMVVMWLCGPGKNTSTTRRWRRSDGARKAKRKEGWKERAGVDRAWDGTTRTRRSKAGGTQGSLSWEVTPCAMEVVRKKRNFTVRCARRACGEEIAGN
ncbi:hypothetical protein TRVL_09820 [Trypanosoma vivax]|nr:hypothetical protein TRVL_09820 [Trypanosoma vivax]